MSKHPAHVYCTLEQLLEDRLEEGDKHTERQRRRLHRMWKRHIARHGNVPLILKCPVCSGEELKQDIKLGKYKVSRPCKADRDAEKDTEDGM